MTGLEQAHAKIADILGPDKTECFEAAAVVEQLRTMWRPDRVRVLLLAESHVWTSREEAECRVLQPDGVETGFARFVYCLGGGEPHLVHPPVFPNVGTAQYWTLFHDTVNGPGRPHLSLTKTGEPNPERRVSNKLALLQEMRASRIWLVDASICALYRAGERLAEGKRYDLLLQTSWEMFVGDVVRTAEPEVVVVIGKQVDRAIGRLLRSGLRQGARM